MLFPTVTFGVFFMVVFAGNWLLRPYRTAWLLFLIVASFFFYGYWDARFVALLAASIAVNWVLGIALGRERERVNEAAHPEPEARWTWQLRALTGVGVALNLAILGWFKYYDFFSTSLLNRLNDAGVDAPVPLIQIILPIGISFITFQAISLSRRHCARQCAVAAAARVRRLCLVLPEPDRRPDHARRRVRAAALRPPLVRARSHSAKRRR